MDVVGRVWVAGGGGTLTYTDTRVLVIGEKR